MYIQPCVRIRTFMRQSAVSAHIRLTAGTITAILRPDFSACHSRRNSLLIGVLVGVIGGLVVLTLILLFVFRRRVMRWARRSSGSRDDSYVI